MDNRREELLKVLKGLIGRIITDEEFDYYKSYLEQRPNERIPIKYFVLLQLIKNIGLEVSEDKIIELDEIDGKLFNRGARRKAMKRITEDLIPEGWAIITPNMPRHGIKVKNRHAMLLNEKKSQMVKKKAMKIGTITKKQRDSLKDQCQWEIVVNRVIQQSFLKENRCNLKKGDIVDGKPIEIQADHLTPIADDGGREEENIIGLCRKHNRRKDRLINGKTGEINLLELAKKRKKERKMLFKQLFDYFGFSENIKKYSKRKELPNDVRTLLRDLEKFC